MSSISFPFTSVGGDRKVTAFQEAQGFNLFVGSGVVEPTAGALGTALEVSAVPDTMGVSVAEGSAINIGHRYIQTGATVLTLDAGGTLDRIDVIAVESNRLNATRASQLVVIKGTEGAVPEAPALTVTDTQYQVALAWVTVPASCTTLNDATVTDKRVASRPRGISSEAQAVIDKHAYKLPVIVATTENITLSGTQTIDGVAVVATNRVLVKNQTDAEDNGIYVAAAGSWVRANDFDSDADAVSGSLIHVESGTANGVKTWKLITPSAISLGTTDLTFAVFDTVKPAYVYEAAGANDGAAISALVNAFLEATGDWAGTTELTYHLKITGTLGLPTTPAYGAGTSGDYYRHFEFSSTQTRGARVILDFSDAQGIIKTISTNDSHTEMFRITGVGARVSIHGLSAALTLSGTGTNARGISVLSGGQLTLVDSYVKAAAVASPIAVYLKSNGETVIDKCELVGASTSDGTCVALSSDDGRARVVASRLYATATSAALSVGALAVGVYSTGDSNLILNGCDIKGKCSGGQSGGRDANAGGVYLHAGVVIVQNCRLLAYTDETGYGVSFAAWVPSAATAASALLIVGCTFPSITVTDCDQTGGVYALTADCRYHIAGNLFSGANSSPYIQMSANSSPAADYYMANNMFSLTLV